MRKRDFFQLLPKYYQAKVVSNCYVFYRCVVVCVAYKKCNEYVDINIFSSWTKETFEKVFKKKSIFKEYINYKKKPYIKYIFEFNKTEFCIDENIDNIYERIEQARQNYLKQKEKKWNINLELGIK